ncbi:MAG: PD-(D/E)XK nuclease family protein, partial [Dehalococcoidia bacterium]
ELDALRLVDEAIEPEAVGFTEFVEMLADRLDRPGTLLREPGGVLLAPMHTLHGLRFRYVYIGGLAEGEFPAPRGAAQLLDEGRRARLADAGLTLPPVARATEDELWQTAASRGETLTSLWRPRLDGSGRPVAASYYFGAGAAAGGFEPVEVLAETAPELTASRPELAVALARGWSRGERRRPAGLHAWDVVRTAAPVEAARRSYASAGRHEGMLQPGAGATHPALARLLGAEGRWSASRVDAYRTCPFQFFASYALGLSEVDEEKASADAATRGTVVHDILEAVLLPLVERALPLDRSTIEDVVARLREQGPRIWDAAPRTYAFGRAALWRYERGDALDQVEALLRTEAASWPSYLDRVGALETEHTVTVPGIEPALQMYAGMDRLDLGPGVARIVDYKTGKTIPEKDVRSGDRVQLPWYAQGARLAYPDVDRVVAKYVYLKPATDPWDLDSARPADVQILDGAIEIALAVRSAAAGGRFEVGPR